MRSSCILPPTHTKLSNTQRGAQHRVCHGRSTAEHSPVPCHNPLLSDGVTHVPRARVVHRPAEETSPPPRHLPAPGTGTAGGSWPCLRLSQQQQFRKGAKLLTKTMGAGETFAPTSSSSTPGRSCGTDPSDTEKALIKEPQKAKVSPLFKCLKSSQIPHPERQASCKIGC